MKKALLLTLKWGGVLTVGIIIGISIKLVTAWVESDQLPPGGNIAAPLNTGSAGQSKKGGLTLNIGGAQYGLIVANGLVGIGTTTPNEKLTVEGNLSLKEGDSSPATTSGYAKIYSKKVDASYTKLLLHADGSNGSTVFGDSSLSTHGVTAYGNAKISTAQSKFGGSSAYFDGSGDYLGVGDSNDWDVGSVDFTLDFWVRPSNVGSDKTLFAKRGSSASINYFTVYISSGSYKFAATSNGSSWDIASGTSMGSANTNAWAHLAVARSGSSILLFQNGSLINTINTSSAILDKDNSSLVIGADTDTGSLDGYIDEFRFSKGVARWTSSFTPPSAAYNAVDSNAAMLYYKNSEGVEYPMAGATTNSNTNASVDVNNINGNVNVNGNVSANAFCLGGDCKSSWQSLGSPITVTTTWNQRNVSNWILGTYDTTMQFTDSNGNIQTAYFEETCTCIAICPSITYTLGVLPRTISKSCLDTCDAKY